MFEALQQADTQCFRWINSHNSTALDWIMWTLSQHWSWAVVLVIAFLALTVRTFHLSPFTFHIEKRWWMVATAVALCFLLADQGSVLIKESVERLRPCHALEDVHMFRTHCGGPYGFVSSHAANAFAVVTFLILCYRKRPWAVVLLTLWAVATCYSRVYLGKHYPGDVVGGIVLGVAVGLVVYWVCKFFFKKVAFP